MAITLEYTLDITRKNRIILKNFLESIALEDLNTIPEGYNNNIVWNIAHVVATQQLLVYKLAGATPRVSQEFIDKYRKGTKPEESVNQDEIDQISVLLESTLEQTVEDYKDGKFKGFTEYTVSTGSTLSSVEEAIGFNNFHEGIHLGSVLALRHAIGLV